MKLRKPKFTKWLKRVGNLVLWRSFINERFLNGMAQKVAIIYSS